MMKSSKLSPGSTGPIKIGAKKSDEKSPKGKEPVDRGERAKGKMPMAMKKRK